MAKTFEGEIPPLMPSVCPWFSFVCGGVSQLIFFRLTINLSVFLPSEVSSRRLFDLISFFPWCSFSFFLFLILSYLFVWLSVCLLCSIIPPLMHFRCQYCWFYVRQTVISGIAIKWLSMLKNKKSNGCSVFFVDLSISDNHCGSVSVALASTIKVWSIIIPIKR